jgi:3-hydroxyacyl-CoA dehydrogenase
MGLFPLKVKPKLSRKMVKKNQKQKKSVEKVYKYCKQKTERKQTRTVFAEYKTG